MEGGGRRGTFVGLSRLPVDAAGNHRRALRTNSCRLTLCARGASERLMTLTWVTRLLLHPINTLPGTRCPSFSWLSLSLLSLFAFPSIDIVLFVDIVIVAVVVVTFEKRQTILATTLLEKIGRLAVSTLVTARSCKFHSNEPINELDRTTCRSRRWAPFLFRHARTVLFPSV